MERIAASVWLLICLFLIYAAQDLNAPYSYEPLGPKPFPLLLLIIMSISSIALISKKQKGTTQASNFTALGRGFVCVIGLLVFGLSIEWLGFIIASFLLAWLQAVLYGGSLIKGAIAALIISLFSYFVFEYILDVPLPSGLLDLWVY